MAVDVEERLVRRLGYDAATNKDHWELVNAGKTASQLGYVLNDAFLEALSHFVQDVVRDSTNTALLGTVAIGYFNNVQPPLERNNGQSR